MRKLWFRARDYGWGWTPVTIEGWLVTAAFLAVVVVDASVFIYRVRTPGSDIRSATITFYGCLAEFVGALIVVCWMKGETPHWRWGSGK